MTTMSPAQRQGNLTGEKAAHVSVELLEKARADTDTVLKELGSQLTGLSEAEADSRLKQVGTNEIAREKRQSALMRLLSNVKNPLVLLLMALGVLSFLTGDVRATVVIFVMVVLGVVLRFFQEMRADNAAAKLQAMVSNTATLVRDGKDAEVSLKMLVPGDIIRLAAGDMVPADARVLSAKDLFLNQAALTGEALPVEKKAAPAPATVQNPLELPNICFLGSNVESGSATAVVIHTGNRTYFGSLAASIVGQRQLTSFDLGVNKFTWLMIRFIAVMVPAVFLINGLSKHNWLEAFLFAMAVAVGLDPRDAAHDRDGQPVQGRPGHVPQESDRQTPKRHPELRGDGRAVHRQDRHPHPGQDRARKAPGRAWRAQRQGAAVWLPE
jgi:P-type Mg2+ transporter